MKLSQFFNSTPRPFASTLRIFVLLLTCVALFASCNDDDDDDDDTQPATQNIAEIVIEGENFTSLEAALIKADLVATFQGTDKFTVFAPTDEAFTALLNTLGVTLDDLTAEDLRPILLRHVVAGEVRSTDLQNGTVETLGGPVTIDLSSGVRVNNATVTQADIEATNGVIHVIDAVIQ